MGKDKSATIQTHKLIKWLLLLENMTNQDTCEILDNVFKGILKFNIARVCCYDPWSSR